MAGVQLCLTLVVGALCLCECEEVKPEGGETPVNQAILLNQFDKELQEGLGKPTDPEQSFEVLKTLVNYENCIKDVYNGMLKNLTSNLEVAKKLVEQNGPEFMKGDFDEENLKKVYDWDDFNLEFFRKSIQDIQTAWKNILGALKGDRQMPLDIYTENRKRAYISKL